MRGWYDNFLDALRRKHPKKSELAEALMDLLAIEKESAYRRLRKDIVFSSHEIAKIAYTWNISVDETLGADAYKVLFRMHLINYLEPTKETLNVLRNRIQALSYLQDAPDSEYILVCNNLLWSLAVDYPVLYKFNVFRWAYEYCNEFSCSNTAFNDLVLSEKLLKEIVTYYRTLKKVANTTYILDGMMFDFTVREIRFYHSIFLISDEDKQALKTALYALLDYLEEVASKGYFPETGRKVQIYISTLNISTNYSYFYCGEIISCCVHAFSMYDIFSYNSEISEDFKVWMQKKKRASILISEADIRSRIEFFKKQREIIDSL
ncbi:MAG: hypothetical protein FWC39_07450 [Bacteroidetes bacterium]|nr:hypothetical protein [Bacteroidota bacterium]